MSNMATDISSKASGHWDKLENIFEDRVAKALNKLGVPSAKDISALIARIDALNLSVQKLSGNTTPAKPAAARKSAVRKTAAAPAQVAKPAPEAVAKVAAKPVAKRATPRKKS